MGLDMYLYKNIYVGAKFSHRNVTGVIDIYAEGEKIPVELNRVSPIREEVGYWRKANAIHAWFVANVQGGNDDCGDYYVSPDNLRELLNVVNEVLGSIKTTEGSVHTSTTYKNGVITENYKDGRIITNPEVVMRLLPTQSGFFFGGTDYDKFYIKDLRHTKDIIERALADDPKAEYIYASSW